MRRALQLSFGLVICVGSALPGRAAEDLCSFQGPVTDYVLHVSEVASAPFEHAVQEGMLDEQAKRASGDGLVDTGRLDLLRRAFVALDLGEVKEEDDSVVFNFNTGGDAAGKFSPRIIVHQAAIFPALAEHIDALADQTAAAARKKALEDGLGELDDVELILRWTPRSQTPERDAALATPVAQAVFNRASTQGLNSADRRAANLADATAKAGTLANMQVQDACATEASKKLLEQVTDKVSKDGAALMNSLSSALAKANFFRLADLLEGEPRWLAEGSFRDRSGAAGPDEGKLTLRFDVGSTNVRRFLKWAARRENQGLTADAALAQYLEEQPATLPTVHFKLDYSRSNALSFAIPEDSAPFEVDAIKHLAASIGAGGFIAKARDRRWLLEASYDDFSDDPSRQNRLVGKLSWVQRLSPDLATVAAGSDFVVSFVYANKPEFRGEVDHDFGLRAGLKWSFDKPTAN